MPELLVNNLDTIFIGIAVLIILLRLSKDQLYKIVETAVKAAEIRYINGEITDRQSNASTTILKELGKKKLSPKLYSIVCDIIDAVVNDLPKTSDRLDKS